jgi:hypothetical protein
MHNIYYKFIAAAIILVSLSCNNKIAYKGGVYSGETEERCAIRIWHLDEAERKYRIPRLLEKWQRKRTKGH